MVTGRNAALAGVLLFAAVTAVLLGTRLQSPVVMAAVFAGAIGLGVGVLIGRVLAPRHQPPAPSLPPAPQPAPPPQPEQEEGMVSILLTEEEVDMLFYLLERGVEMPEPTTQQQTVPTSSPSAKEEPSTDQPKSSWRSRRGREFIAVGGATIRDDEADDDA